VATWALASAGCQPGRPPALAPTGGGAATAAALASAIAVVEGVAISGEQVRLQAQASGQGVREALGSLVEAELLFAEARRRGIDADPEVRAALAAELVRTLLARTFEREVTPAQVSEAEIRAAYARNADTFDPPEIRQVTHILVPFGKPPPDAARRQLLRARAEAVAGRARAARSLAEFKAIGPALSDGSLTLLVEQLATGPSGFTVPPFADAAFALPRPGAVSGVVETRFGFHVIYLERIQPPHHVPIDEVRDQLRAGLWPEVRRREFARRVDRLLEEGKEQRRVEVHPERLPDSDTP
jgi:peptidyl-prolyl cis-trans isomerase C